MVTIKSCRVEPVKIGEEEGDVVVSFTSVHGHRHRFRVPHALGLMLEVELGYALRAARPFGERS